MNEKITGSRQISLSPKHYIKCYKQQKRTLKTVKANKLSKKKKNNIAIHLNLLDQVWSFRVSFWIFCVISTFFSRFEWLFFKKVVICLVPTKHLGVPITSFKRVRAFQIELEFRSVGFLGGWEGKTGVPGYFHLSLSFVAVLFEFWYWHFVIQLLYPTNFAKCRF